jgi:hypothetical protein
MIRSRREFIKTSFVTVGVLSFIGLAGRAFSMPRKANPTWDGVIRDSVVVCPACKSKVQERMSSESVKRIYHCPTCLTWLSTKKGDHCIYDSYGSVKCPATQLKERRAKNLAI